MGMRSTSLPLGLASPAQYLDMESPWYLLFSIVLVASALGMLKGLRNLERTLRVTKRMEPNSL